MALRLLDKWLWDFWLARDGPDYHVFYLQAPRSLEKQELRHWNVSVGKHLPVEMWFDVRNE